jgi:sugar porter (SP) family MFS transporter
LSVSIYLVGGCAGAFSAGWFADKFGRKKALLICHVFGFVSAALFGFCKMGKSFEMLILGRLIVGFGCGAGSGLVPMYLTEIAPVNIRGAMGVLHQFALTCGILVSQIMGIRQALGTEALWPILLAFTVFPCLVSLIILPWFPDSPRHLLVNLKEVEQAREALQRFRGTTDVDLDIQEMELEQQQMALEKKWSFKQLLLSKSLRMPLALVCGLACCQQLSGINVVFYYSTGVFEDSGIPPEKTQYAVIGTGIVNVLMTGISVPLMEKSGRRPLLLVGMMMMAAASVVITVALNLQGQVHWMSYISILCIIAFVIGFAIGLGSIPQFIGAELFKQGPRPPAMSLAGFLNWLCNFLVGISFPSMQTAMQAYSFTPFIAILILFWIFLFWKLPETKNKTYEEIYQIFQMEEEDELEKPETVGGRLAHPELESAPFLDKYSKSNGTVPQSASNTTETSFLGLKENGENHNNDQENGLLLDQENHVAKFTV